MTIRALLDFDRGSVERLLARGPERHMFVLARIEKVAVASGLASGGSLFGATEKGSLRGVLFRSQDGLLVLAECAAEAQRLFARLVESAGGAWRALCCPEEDAEAFLAEARDMGIPLELDRRQIFCVLRPEASSDVPAVPGLRVRPAGPDDVAVLAEMDVRLAEEDLGVARDPRARPAVEESLRRRISAGEIYLATLDDAPVFKASVGTRSARHGAQVEGIFTQPALRNRGIASAALGILCRELVSASPSVCLHVAERNAAALACYRKVGFVPQSFFRLARRARTGAPGRAEISSRAGA